MAEAVYHGKTSSAWWKASGGAFAQITGVTEWSVTLKAKTAESTIMTTTLFGKTREVGFKGSTAKVTCYISGTPEIFQNDKGSLECLRGATNTLGGYALGVLATDGAICTGSEVGADKDGIETITYNFIATGTVSNTVTQGA